jgi:predicted DNA-binding transcriptional regulator AlpA
VTTQEFEILRAKIDGLAIPFEHRIWNTLDIAEHMKLEYSTVRDTIITKPSFPKPVRKASGRAKATFYAAEVVAWIENERSKS